MTIERLGQQEREDLEGFISKGTAILADLDELESSAYFAFGTDDALTQSLSGTLRLLMERLDQHKG